jgi:hypothetical protein
MMMMEKIAVQQKKRDFPYHKILIFNNKHFSHPFFARTKAMGINLGESAAAAAAEDERREHDGGDIPKPYANFSCYIKMLP